MEEAMDSEVEIKELFELLNILEFEKILFNEAEALKKLLEDKIDFYKNIKKNFPEHVAGEGEESKSTDSEMYISDRYKKKTEAANYNELISYMERFPQFKDRIFSEFFMKWKPLIDNGLIDFTSS
jgi:hypothetical protein